MMCPYDTSNLIQLPLLDPIRIPLSRGREGLIDPIDADLAVFKWCLGGRRKPYVVRNIRIGRGQWKTEILHRVIMARMLNRCLNPGEEVDHVDCNPSNNVRSNLRLATPAQNKMNRTRYKNNTSGYKGVCYVKDRRGEKHWKASINLDDRNIHLGYYATAQEAHAAYCEAAQKYHGEFARTE